jgi:MarR family transcriptional repressor of emrRAB
LSESGRALIEQALPDVSGNVTSAYADCSPTELRQLAALCLRVLGNLSDEQ